MVESHLARLADRLDDLALLQRHFVSKFSAQYHKEIRGLTQRAQIVLASYNWPGNIRELENVIGHACIMALGDTIDVQDFPDYLRHTTTPRVIPELPPGPEPAPIRGLEDQEQLLLRRALEAANGNQTQAARILSISRDRLRYKMKKHGLQER